MVGEPSSRRNYLKLLRSSLTLKASVSLSLGLRSVGSAGSGVVLEPTGPQGGQLVMLVPPHCVCAVVMCMLYKVQGVDVAQKALDCVLPADCCHWRGPRCICPRHIVVFFVLGHRLRIAVAILSSRQAASPEHTACVLSGLPWPFRSPRILRTPQSTVCEVNAFACILKRSVLFCGYIFWGALTNALTLRSQSGAHKADVTAVSFSE